ncbi:MAG TPA: class I SAM-dependent methyltransferase [Acidimicrobiia bacterium]|nr:class I SAM-dependent methyltransferase [Acidimicrobiia bacterium]
MGSPEGYDAATYGDAIADVYDDLPTHPPDADEAAELLAEVAGSGPALELAIGTGRIALPLVRRGVPVSGIDASEAMVARLRAKPGGERLPVTIGDFADVDVDGRFALVFVVYNTFFALLDQASQQRCFRRVAEHLAPGGRFVIEAFVPDLSRFERGQRVEVRHIDSESALLMLSRHRPAAQRVDSMLIRIANDSVRTWPVPIRYSYPSELDLMAEQAGLQPEHRWGGWARQPFTDASVKHVSVYAPTAAGTH